MFSFITRYLGFLKHVPLVPHVYDALLKIQLFFTNRKVLDYLDEVEKAVGGWDQVFISMHKYGGTQFNMGTHELGHLHGNGLLDVLLTRSIKTEIMLEPAILDHHTFKNSGWISLWIKTPKDRDLAIDILSKAYAFRMSKPH